MGIGLNWAYFVGPIWVLYGPSGYGLELVIHVWGLCGICVGKMGMGYNWSSMFGAHVGFVWAKWAWVRNGHTCLGPMWVVVGLIGHG